MDGCLTSLDGNLRDHDCLVFANIFGGHWFLQTGGVSLYVEEQSPCRTLVSVRDFCYAKPKPD